MPTVMVEHRNDAAVESEESAVWSLLCAAAAVTRRTQSIVAAPVYACMHAILRLCRPRSFNQSEFDAVFNLAVPLQNSAWLVFRLLLSLGSFLDGVVGDADAYRRLIGYSRKSPIIGYAAVGKPRSTFEVRKTDAKGGQWSSGPNWLNSYAVIGTFQILSRQAVDNRVQIFCLWVTGQHIGSTFLITGGRDLALASFRSSDVAAGVPARIYCLPRLATFILSAVGAYGLGNLSGVINLIKGLVTWIVGRVHS